MNFSMKTRSSPNDDLASERARAKPSATSPRGMGDAHALAAAAGRGLDHHGIADLVGDPDRLGVVLDHAEMAGHGRDLGGGGRLLGFDLVAHGGDRPGIGADEDDAGLGQRARRRPRARTGSHSPDAPPRPRSPGRPRRSCRSRDSFRRPAAGRCERPRRPFPHGGHRVGVGIDRDGRDPHAPRGLDDAAGDFAAIGDQNALEHAVQYPEMPAYRALRCRHAIVNATLDCSWMRWRQRPATGMGEVEMRTVCEGRKQVRLQGRNTIAGTADGGALEASGSSRRLNCAQCVFERFRPGTWETIQFRISVSMSVSAPRGAHDANEVVGDECRRAAKVPQHAVRRWN